MPIQEEQEELKEILPNQQKLSLTKACLQEIKQQFNEASQGLEEISRKIHHHKEILAQHLQHSTILEEECRTILKTINTDELQILDYRNFAPASQEYHVIRILQFYLNRPLICQKDLIDELSTLNKDIPQDRLQEIEELVLLIDTVLIQKSGNLFINNRKNAVEEISQDVILKLAKWCIISSHQSKIILLANNLERDLIESEVQYNSFNEKIKERKSVIQEVEKELSDLTQHQIQIDTNIV